MNRGDLNDLVCSGLPAGSRSASARRDSAGRKMISWAAIVNAIAAFAKGALLALELFRQDDSGTDL